MKKVVVLLLIGTLGVTCVACGNRSPENNTTQSSEQKPSTQKPQNTQEDSTKPSTPPSESESTQKDTQEQDTTNDKVTTIKDAKDILTQALKNFKSDDKDELTGPNKYDLEKAEELEKTFFVPKDAIKLVDDVATLYDGKDENEFVVVAAHLKDKKDMIKVSDSIKNAVLNNQWKGDQPERLVIVNVGEDYIVVAFGDDDEAAKFQTSVVSVYNKVAKVIADEDI